MIKNRKINNIEYGIKQVQKLYIQRGFKTTCIHADSYFEPLREKIADIGISLNCASKKEHVPDIEWLKRTVKENIQCSGSAMLFKWIYKLIIVYIFAFAIILG